MATYIATGDVSFGQEDGKIKVFHDGDTVTGPSEDQFKQLVDAGAIVLKADYRKARSPEEEEQERAAAEELRKRNGELETELTKLRAQLAAASNPPDPKKPVDPSAS